MNHSHRGRRLARLCGAGALVLPLSVLAQPVIEDLSDRSRTFYEQAEVREGASGSLMLLNRLDEQQREIQQLRGQVEELRHQLEQLRRDSQARYLDLEQRLASGVAPQEVDAEAARQVAEAGAGSGSAPPGADAQAAYQAAFQRVQARDFPAAIAAFEAFVVDYPDTNLTANGHYWLGELYSAETRLEPAAAAFQTVLDDYPESNKVPDALYKLGLLKARQGQPDASRTLLERLITDYPDSNAAVMGRDFLNDSGL
ncbi:tol-pal system protein YbgF [Halomonas salifodinae]|uniref:tol-pal system protein YbgF n=1 Tax=Halomonas salifodinae TaxID=438745 RepID=UPI00339F700B